MSGTASRTRSAPGGGRGRRHLRAGAGSGQRWAFLPAARTLRVCLCARDRHCLAELRRCAQAQGDQHVVLRRILSKLYLSSGVLKRWEDEGRQEADLPLVEWCMETGFATIQARFDADFLEFPVRPAAWLLRFLLLSLGRAAVVPPIRRRRSAQISCRSHRPRATASRWTFSMAPRHGRASRRASSSPSRPRARSSAQGACSRHRSGACAGPDDPARGGSAGRGRASHRRDCSR